MSKPMLPDWLIEELPEVKPAAVISMAGEAIRLTMPDGQYSDYATLDAVASATRSVPFTIEDDVYRHFDQEPGSFGLFYPTSKNFSSMLMSLTDADRLSMIERDYEHSLRNHIRYQADPTSFYNAYHFIDAHPAFWTRHAGDLDRFPWDWNTSGHCNKIEQFIMKVEREEDNPEAFPQGYVVALETGSHVEGNDAHMGRPGYTSHYHDYRFDVYELTFEAAIVELAARLDKFFFIDGTEKPDVDHVKPAWILELESRIEEFDALRAEDEDADE